MKPSATKRLALFDRLAELTRDDPTPRSPT